MLTTAKHQPGRLTSSKDAAPEFAAQTLPPGTAPRESTFQPQPTEDVQQSTSLATDSSTLEGDSTAAAADATLTGATSADVNAGLGKPIQGQSATERQHDGAHERVKQRHGLEGVGAGGGPGPRAGDGRTA